MPESGWVCKYCYAVHNGSTHIRQHCSVCNKNRTKATGFAASRGGPVGYNSTAVSNAQDRPVADRVRVGWRTNVRGWDDNGTERSGKWIRFYIPTSFGRPATEEGNGLKLEMRLTTSSGSFRYHGKSAGLRRPYEEKSDEIVRNLEENSHGWYYAQLEGTTNANVSLVLLERGYAREDAALDAEALIPWSFYYWSFSRYAHRPVAWLKKNEDPLVRSEYGSVGGKHIQFNAADSSYLVQRDARLPFNKKGAFRTAVQRDLQASNWGDSLKKATYAVLMDKYRGSTLEEIQGAFGAPIRFESQVVDGDDHWILWWENGNPGKTVLFYKRGTLYAKGLGEVIKKRVNGSEDDKYEPLVKYDDKFSGGASPAADWESDPANDHKLVADRDNPTKYFEGHCNWASAASIYFAKPETIEDADNGNTFHDEELKLLAMEWTANHETGSKAFALGTQGDVTNPRDDAVNLRAPVTARSADQVQVKATADYNAPVGVDNAADLVNNQTYTVEMSSCGSPTNGWFKTPAGDWIPAASLEFEDDGEKDSAALRSKYGIEAAALHKALREKIATEGKAMVSDLRASAGSSPDEVWNQAVFMYEATFHEHPDADELYGGGVQAASDIVARVNLWANADTFPSDAMPARWTGDDVELTTYQQRVRRGDEIIEVPRLHAWCRNLLYRLLFNPEDGEIDDAWTGGDWMVCCQGWNNDFEAWDNAIALPTRSHHFAPGYLSELGTPNNCGNHNVVGTHTAGNPHVKLAELQDLGMELRAQYQ